MFFKKKVAVIGLGLIGGSVSLALKKALEKDIYIIGIDIDTDAVKLAKEQKAIDSSDISEIDDADFILIALSPKKTVKFVSENVSRFKKDIVVTDVCGVKRAVVESCEKLCITHGVDFIGGHPMAGKEKGGFQNADANLFVDASYILTKTDKTTNKALTVMTEFLGLLRCKKPTITTTENHDRMIAFTSQLPHILAGAYVLSPRCKEHEGYSAGSFTDVSRVAAVDENLWSELFINNHDFLFNEIELFISRLNDMRDAIKGQDIEKAKKLIQLGRARKEEVDRTDERFE